MADGVGVSLKEEKCLPDLLIGSASLVPAKYDTAGIRNRQFTLGKLIGRKKPSANDFTDRRHDLHLELTDKDFDPWELLDAMLNFESIMVVGFPNKS